MGERGTGRRQRRLSLSRLLLIRDLYRLARASVQRRQVLPILDLIAIRLLARIRWLEVQSQWFLVLNVDGSRLLLLMHLPVAFLRLGSLLAVIPRTVESARRMLHPLNLHIIVA